MDIVPSLEEFRDEARRWLAAHAERRNDGESHWGVGSDSVAVFHDRSEAEERSACDAACTWHREKLADGWAALTWPRELGGRGLPLSYEHAFAIEEADFVTPSVPEVVTITLSLVAPTIAVFGTEEQKAAFLPAFLETSKLSCQLFSEPGAGSDLASLSCRAKRSGPDWLIDGQKIWTSGAGQSHFGLLIARSDPAAAKHAGMTAFLLPLDTPGVEIRPIRQMTGGASFSEVFLSDVRVPDRFRIGAEGHGWKVATTMLGFERSVSGAGGARAGGSWKQVLALARHFERTSDPLVRQALAHLYTRSRVLELTNERTRGALLAGQPPGAAGSICKLLWTQVLSETSDVVSRLLGPRLLADTGEWGTYAWAEHVLGAPGYRIAGGSDEIQQNIIAQRVLGLPREPSRRDPDRHKPN